MMNDDHLRIVTPRAPRAPHGAARSIPASSGTAPYPGARNRTAVIADPAALHARAPGPRDSRNRRPARRTSIARPSMCRLWLATPLQRSCSIALVCGRAIARDHAEHGLDAGHARDVVQIIQQRRVDRVLLAGAVIAQQRLEWRERIGHVIVAATKYRCRATPACADSRARSAGLPRPSPRAGALGRHARGRHSRETRPPASSTRRRLQLIAAPLRARSRPRSMASTVARGKKLNSVADAQV